MVEFEQIEAERIDYGKFGGENFVEVSRNKAIKDDGSFNTFIQISTGYHTEEGPRYKKRFTVPKNEDAVKHILEHLPVMLEKELMESEEEDGSEEDADDTDDDVDDDAADDTEDEE